MAAIATQDVDALAEQWAEIFEDLGALGELLEIRANGVLAPFGWDNWHEEQRDFERDRSGWDVILKSRQIGISTLELARDLQYARTHTGVQVVVVVQDEAAKAELFESIKIMAAALEGLGLCPPPLYSTKTELRWADNRSVVKILEAGNTEKNAAKRGRSGTIHRLHATEVAFWTAASTTLNSLLDAVPKSGEVCIESTANGQGTVFHAIVQLAMAGVGRYRFHFFPWYAHREKRTEHRPNLYTRTYPADERAWINRYKALGLDDAQIQWWVDQVDVKRALGGLELVLQEQPPTPEAAFRAGEDQWIPAWACDALDALKREPLRKHELKTAEGRVLGELSVFEEPSPGEEYIIGADVSEGVGKDASTIDVMHALRGVTVATFAANGIEPGDHGHAIATAGKLYNTALAAPERNKDGAAVLRVLTHEAQYPRIYEHEDGRLGFPTTTATRPVLWDLQFREIIDAAKQVLEGHAMAEISPDAAFHAECRSLVKVDGKPVARGKGNEGGATDDRYVARAIARYVRLNMPLGAIAEDASSIAEKRGARDLDGFRSRGGNPWT
jgi:hypothetical protein